MVQVRFRNRTVSEKIIGSPRINCKLPELFANLKNQVNSGANSFEVGDICNILVPRPNIEAHIAIRAKGNSVFLPLDLLNTSPYLREK